MKKLLLAAAILGLSGSAYAADNGFYLGANAGWANTGDTASLGSYADDTNNVFAGRVSGGYQFTPNFAAELGYMKLSNSKSDFLDIANTTLKTQVFDVVGKVMYPIQNSGFGIYGKAGAACVDDTMDVNLLGNSASGTTRPVRPELGAGITYYINQNLVADVDYTYINGNHSIDSINAVTAGLAYHFS